MLLPSRTVYGTKNWPELGWFEKAEPSGSAFFLRVFQEDRGGFIAGKPAPTFDRLSNWQPDQMWELAWLR